MNNDIDKFVMNLPAVDAHEHLLPETERLNANVDVLYLFHQYVISDLRSAGMPEISMEKIRTGDGTLDERWHLFKPYLRYIRHTGFARPVFTALREIYGVAELNEDNYQAVSEKIQAENTPGITDRCLGQRGKIRTILNCNYRFEQPTPYSRGIMPSPSVPLVDPADFLRQAGQNAGIGALDGVDKLTGWVKYLLDDYCRHGIIALKTTARECLFPDAGQAEKHLLNALRTNQLAEQEAQVINDYLLDTALRHMPLFNLTMAVHTGMFAGANTFFLRSHVRHIVPLLSRHPDVRFDIFHLSYPWTAEAIAIAQKFTNAHLNLTWLPTLNPEVTRRAMREIICSVPCNKVLAMGGDYWRLPDVAYGHLQLARQLFAGALSECMDSGWLDLESAKDIARLWLHDNAFTIYPLAH